MDRLPPELKIPIMQQVSEESPPGMTGVWAAVSRNWQALIEPTSFASLRLSQTCLAQARKILTPVRQSYVRCIDFTVTLPCYDPGDPETETERRQNNEAFSDAMAELLGLFCTWCDVAASGCRNRRGIELRLSAASATDKGRLNCRADLPLPHSEEWKAERCISSFVGLRDDTFHQRLPEVPIVETFTCLRATLDQRRLVPRTCCELTSRFPNLRNAYWDLADGAHDNAFRVQQRRDFAAALFPATPPNSQRLIPQSLRHLSLWYGTHTSAFELRRKFIRKHSAYHDYVVNIDPVLCPEGTPDDLSLALAALSMQLVSADFRGTIGEEFWSSLAPEEKEGDDDNSSDEKKKNDERRRHDQSPCRLRHLSVVVGTHTPQGVFQYRYDPKVDPPYVEGGRLLENAPRVKIDPAWMAAMHSARRRVPGMEIELDCNMDMPGKLLYPDGPGCGAFTRTTRYVDENGVERY
ncbi:hypothetical protein PG991_000155 [Apiospora marii]|uniref:F-box domain-containing protein n=1 Tax=Apiospora marii TaxID=335849 RepID=A0ABR1T1C1_9PEZI